MWPHHTSSLIDRNKLFELIFNEIVRIQSIPRAAAATTKRPLLSPGAAHDHRAATELSPESADEIGCASRRGGRSGWRPSMMNGGEERHHVCLVEVEFLIVVGNHSFTSPGSIQILQSHHRTDCCSTYNFSVLRPTRKTKIGIRRKHTSFFETVGH